MNSPPLVFVVALLLTRPCVAEDPVHLVVERDSNHWFSHTHMTPGARRVVFSDNDPEIHFVGRDEEEADEDEFVFVSAVSFPQAPMRIHWIGSELELPDNAMGVEALKDGRFLVATSAQLAEPEEAATMYSTIARFEKLEIAVIGPEGEMIGSMKDLKYWPMFLDGNRYFDKARNQIRTMGDSEAPVNLAIWVDIIGSVDGHPDVAIYSAAIFNGLMTSAGRLLTGATWLNLEDLGDGHVAAYGVGGSVEILDEKGEQVAALPPGYAESLGDGTFVSAGVASTVRIGRDGRVIWTLPYRAHFDAIRSPMGRFLVGVFDDDREIGRYRIWDRDEDRFVRDLPFDRLWSADDESPYLVFEEGSDAGVLNDSGDEIFRLIASGPPFADLQEGDERQEWRAYGRIYRNATMFQLIVRSVRIESGVHVHGEQTHEYLINAEGEVLWRTDGAPDPMVKHTSRPKP